MSDVLHCPQVVNNSKRCFVLKKNNTSRFECVILGFFLPLAPQQCILWPHI